MSSQNQGVLARCGTLQQLSIRRAVILTMVYYIPYLTGYYNPLYNPTNQGFFHCSSDVFFRWNLEFTNTWLKGFTAFFGRLSIYLFMASLKAENKQTKQTKKQTKQSINQTNKQTNNKKYWHVKHVRHTMKHQRKPIQPRYQSSLLYHVRKHKHSRQASSVGARHRTCLLKRDHFKRKGLSSKRHFLRGYVKLWWCNSFCFMLFMHWMDGVSLLIVHNFMRSWKIQQCHQWCTLGIYSNYKDVKCTTPMSAPVSSGQTLSTAVTIPAQKDALHLAQCKDI